MTNELITVTNVVSREITGLDVVNSVNGFYSGAFDKLFGLVLALIALFGVILPIVIQIYQRRVMKVSEAELKAEMAKLLNEKKAELLQEVEKKFNAEKQIITASLKENIDTIEKRQNKAQGDVFQLQASNRGVDDMVEQCHDLCMAAEYYCKSDGGADLSRVIKGLTIAVLPKLTGKDLEKDGLNERLMKILMELNKWNHNDLLADLILNFKGAIKEAKGRNTVNK
jgi:hypothetical protein